MLTVLIWWLWMLVMGLVALPLAHRFFRRLPGRGYAFARPLGLLLTSYVLWLGASLGLLRNSLGGALFSLAAVAVLSFVVYRRGRSEDEPGLLAWLRANVGLVLVVELLYAGALILWAALRAYSPDLTTAGGEKFMEIMYLNSIGRSEYFPPNDAWLSGYAISYYYFGYVMTALLTLLSGLPAHLTFNVGLSNLFALTCTGAFGLVYALVAAAELAVAERAREEEAGQRLRPSLWGLLGAVLVAFLGNLEGFLEVLYSLRWLPQGFWQWLDIKDINQPFDLAQQASLMPARSGWWWWRASRVIHDLDPTGASMGLQPIDEFPGFSFLLGDMHPHVLALPFVLLVLAIAFDGLLRGDDEEQDRTEAAEGWQATAWQASPWLAPVRRLPLLVPLCLGALFVLNAWDFPIYWLVYVVAYGLGRWKWYGRLSWAFLRDVGVTGVAAGFFGFLFFLPFYIGFRSQAGGLLPTFYVGTRFRQYFVMFGPFLVAIAGLMTLAALRLREAVPGKHLLRSWAGWLAAFLLLPLAIMLLVVGVLLLTPQGQEMLEGIRRMPAVYEMVGDQPWPELMVWMMGVKLRSWVMPLVVAAMAALGAALLQLSVGGRRTVVRREQTEEKEGDHAGSPLPDMPPTHGVGEGKPGGGSSKKADHMGSPLPKKAPGWVTASLRFVLLCAITGLLLTLSVEFVYLVDNFRARMNTIFKFYFQGWVLMAVASAFAVYWLSRRREAVQGAVKVLRGAFLAGFWVLFIMGLFYPVLGNITRAGNFEQVGEADHRPTLDGTAYLAQGQADDYEAIAWLNENVEGAPVILEKPGTGGSSYVYEGRVSALTGLPTLLGWAGHEGQWRGSYEVQQAREPDIETIYASLDANAARELLEAYDVVYVYVGPLERTTYDPRALDKLALFMDVVYENEGVTIYKRTDSQ
jgi:YYY domain-containing protein